MQSLEKADDLSYSSVENKVPQLQLNKIIHESLPKISKIVGGTERKSKQFQLNDKSFDRDHARKVNTPGSLTVRKLIKNTSGAEK